MKNLKQVILVLFVTATFLVAGMSDVFARRGGGSRSSSRSSSRSTTKSRPTTSKSRPSAVKPSTKSTKSVSKGRTTTAPKRSAAQQKSFESSKKNGTSKMTKTQSMDKFKNDPAMKSKYTSKYSSKPATRPSHVPATTRVGNTNVNINYNSSMGGYGYMNTLGAFIMYDMMSDALMRDRMMTNNGYLYAGHPNVAVVHTRGGFGLIWVLLGLVGVVIIVGIIVVAAKN